MKSLVHVEVLCTVNGPHRHYNAFWRSHKFCVYFEFQICGFSTLRPLLTFYGACMVMYDSQDLKLIPWLSFPHICSKFNGLEIYFLVVETKNSENEVLLPNFQLWVTALVNICWPRKFYHRKVWNEENILNTQNVSISTVDQQIFNTFYKKLHRYSPYPIFIIHILHIKSFLPPH